MMLKRKDAFKGYTKKGRIRVEVKWGLGIEKEDLGQDEIGGGLGWRKINHT